MRNAALAIVATAIIAAGASAVQRTFGPEWTKMGDVYRRKVEVHVVHPAQGNESTYSLPLEKGGVEVFVREADDGRGFTVGSEGMASLQVLKDEKGRVAGYTIVLGDTVYRDADGDGVFDSRSDGKAKRHEVLVDGRFVEASDTRIAALIRQLGDGAFGKREEATRQLQAIGRPALGALRTAVASVDDLEIHFRARQLVRTILEPEKARERKRELERFAGTWAHDIAGQMTIVGSRWTSSTPGETPRSGRFEVVEIQEKQTLVDFWVEDGSRVGETCRAIFRLDDEILHYCGTYGPDRPTEFKAEGANYYAAYRRVKR